MFDQLNQILARALNKSVDRLDATETAQFARALERIKARTFDVKYADLKARKFIPVSSECSNADTAFTYRQWDWRGMAKIVANYATDFPSVTAMAKEFTAKIVSVGDSYSYSVQDVRAAMQSGNELPTRLQTAAYRAINNTIDEIAAKGIPDQGVPGFLNHPNVPLLTLPTGNWAGATDTQILADLAYMATQITVNTDGVHTPDTVLFDSQSWGRVSQMVTGSGTFADTVLSVFLRTNPYVKNADLWIKLDTADAAGTGPRVVMYRRDPEILELEIPQEPEEFPPQAAGMAFVINCHARVGGLRMSYPLACAFADNHY